MKDHARVKIEILAELFSTSSRQLDESANSIDEIKSILNWAKTPSERTAINIILDDQKKVAKALERLVRDLAEMQ